MLVSQKANNNLGAYPPELRAFAMALKFYSTKAYNYLRESFDKEIKWQYLIELKELHGAKGLRLANKLRLAHINWKPRKMKVNLAAQVLSSTVADALEFCEGKLKLPQFQGCGPTGKFIRAFDRLFDIVNSKNPLPEISKRPSGNRIMCTRKANWMRQASTFVS